MDIAHLKKGMLDLRAIVQSLGGKLDGFDVFEVDEAETSDVNHILDHSQKLTYDLEQAMSLIVQNKIQASSRGTELEGLKKNVQGQKRKFEDQELDKETAVEVFQKKVQDRKILSDLRGRELDSVRAQLKSTAGDRDQYKAKIQKLTMKQIAIQRINADLAREDSFNTVANWVNLKDQKRCRRHPEKIYRLQADPDDAQDRIEGSEEDKLEDAASDTDRVVKIIARRKVALILS